MKKTGGIYLFVVNALSTIVTILFYRLFSGIAFAFGTLEDPERTETIFTIMFLVMLVVEILKWVSYYFVIVHRKKSWLLFYLVYTMAIFFISVEAIHVLFIFVLLYTIVLMHVHKCLEDEEEQKESSEEIEEQQESEAEIPKE